MKAKEIILSLLLVLTVVGCTAAGEPTASPVPSAVPTATPRPPTPTPLPDSALETAVNRVAGVTVRYPSDWHLLITSHKTLITPSEEVAQREDLGAGPFFLIVSGPPDEMEELGFPGATLSERLNHLQESLADAPGYLILKPPYEETIGGKTFRLAQISLLLRPDRPPYHLILLVYCDDALALTGLVGAPEEAWATYGPIFRQMIETMVLSEPQPVVEKEQGALAMDESRAATLEGGVIDVWTFDNPGNTLVNVDLQPRDGLLDPYLVVRDEEGNVVAANDDRSASGRGAGIDGLWLARPGRYRFEVHAKSGMGDYDLTLTSAKEEALQRHIAYGESISDTLRGNGERHLWSFEGRAGDQITITMNGEKIDAYLELYAPDGELLLRDDDSGGGTDARIALTLPQDGTYYILAYAVDPMAGGLYDLSLTLR